MMTFIRSNLSFILFIILVLIIFPIGFIGMTKITSKKSESDSISQQIHDYQKNIHEFYNDPEILSSLEDNDSDSSDIRIWKSSETGLPIGVVVGGECDNGNSSINWLSIRQSDGHMIIAKNIDGQLWGAVMIGDIIE